MNKNSIPSGLIYSAKKMDMHEVSKNVNSTKNNYKEIWKKV